MAEPLPQSFSFWGTRAMCSGFAAIYGAFAGALASLILEPVAGEDNVGYVVLAMAAVGFARGASVRVNATDHHIVVRNPFRTYRVPWESIRDIVDAQPWWFKGLVCPAVRTRDGRRPRAIYAMVAWDRLISSDPSRSAVRAAHTIRRWGKEHHVRVAALTEIRAGNAPTPPSEEARNEAAFRAIVAGIREGMEDIARRVDATLIDASGEDTGIGAPPLVFRLVPSSPAAATVEVMPDDVYSTFIGLGRGGWIEVFTSPKEPDRGVSDTLQIVEAVVRGRVRETIWTRKTTGKFVDSLLRWQMTEGDRWRMIGEIGRPLPILRDWLHDEEVIEYQPYPRK